MVRRALVVLGLLSGIVRAESIAGTVTQFKGNPLEMGVQQDGGPVVFVRVGPDTEVVQVPPGERDLAKAKSAGIPDIVLGDRVLISTVPDMADARRVILITARDIAARNEAERLDWQKRGISGTVASKNSEEIALEMRTPEGVKTIRIMLTAKTGIRRYASGSVKFSDAQPSTVDEIETGDQLKFRGDKNEDGSRLSAQDIVFGTFLTKVGSIAALDAAKNEIKITDLTTNKPLTIRLTKDSQLKLLPDARAMMGAMFSGGHGGNSAPAAAPTPMKLNLTQLLESLPSGKMEDLKPGGIIVVTSTKGVKSDELTAITILGNADFMLQSARQAAGEGVNAAEAMGRLHGGMLGGPAGINLPAMIP